MGVAAEREDMVLPPRAPDVTPGTVAFYRPTPRSSSSSATLNRRSTA